MGTLVLAGPGHPVLTPLTLSRIILGGETYKGSGC